MEKRKFPLMPASLAGLLLMSVLTVLLVTFCFPAAKQAAAATKTKPVKPAKVTKTAAPVPFIPPAGPSGGVALIYNGKTAAEGAPEALAVAAKSLGMKVTYFDSPAKLPALLNGATICMVGGTEDDLNPLLAQFTPAIRKTLADWVSAGGSYLGICGGAYIASQGWEEESGIVKGFGLAPVLTEAWVEDPDPMIITVTWNGAQRQIYYQYGPAFLVKKNSAINVLARYDDGMAAALAVKLGKGKVIVCGPHPEADETWLEDDPEPTDADTWTPTRDLMAGLLRKFFS